MKEDKTVFVDVSRCFSSNGEGFNRFMIAVASD